jgi:mono/diheme cytochrome c family protein
MKKFVAGLFVGVGCLLAAVFCYVYFGFVNPRADTPVGSIEKGIAMPALDAAVDRRAPEEPDPLLPTPANLAAGMNIFQSNCASCHGDPVHPEAQFAHSFHPPPPQFVNKAPDMPADENFYIITHGVRWSGMPAWEQTLTPHQIWLVTTFLGKMDQLPAPLAQQWRAQASGAAPAH